MRKLTEKRKDKSFKLLLTYTRFIKIKSVRMRTSKAS